jgi:hypothetical protein
MTVEDDRDNSPLEAQIFGVILLPVVQLFTKNRTKRVKSGTAFQRIEYFWELVPLLIIYSENWYHLNYFP